MRTRTGLVALLLAAAALLSGCTDGAEMAQQYVAYVHDHPLKGGHILQASGHKDTSECGCSWMRVVLSVDGVIDLSQPDVAAANLASVLAQACAFEPSDSVDEEWIVDQIGSRRQVSVSNVVDGPPVSSADRRCGQARIDRQARALVDKIARMGR